MFFAHATRSLIFKRARSFATAQPKESKLDILAKLDADHARVLRAVQNRVAMRAKLQSELSDEMSSPEDIARIRKLRETEELGNAWKAWTETREQMKDTYDLLEDPDPSMRTLAADEITGLSSTLVELAERTFPSLLIPPSTTKHLSALMELKSGVGGSEASLFLSDMLKIYQRLAVSHRWKVTIAEKNDLEGTNGIKDAVVEFKGQGAYDTLRWESGVHRVQRVPATEASGRTHTSTVAIVVLPLMEETDAHDAELFNMADVKIEVMRARGAGGQHVNRTESAVRLTHIPTGITVSMQDERSQHTNRRRAFQVLTARLMDQKLTREMEERRASRRSLVQGADRSEKIRTYNYAQDRVTDHRIGLTMKNLTSVVEDDGIELFINGFEKHYQESLMLDILDEGQ
ncbi:hypothetical protein D9619_010421 [Psilocybe cf. subviscida]|uniref:Prokaryotic-type class I peptide chain release factors domain-containing protein n=1 Tax=Psilocybe cf. subviscida TaxID=2480587 RepID=A0A8H5ES18_9AGAR|nr:hypothetical protein D9619_010421 [Psilocybe cf. subviscida]